MCQVEKYFIKFNFNALNEKQVTMNDINNINEY